MRYLWSDKPIIRSATLICALCALSGLAVAQDYDLVILDGRVMDPETGYDAIANVGVKDGTIAVITGDKITGKETIDATGHVVAPGFIDTHWHYDRPRARRLWPAISTIPASQFGLHHRRAASSPSASRTGHRPSMRSRWIPAVAYPVMCRETQV